jgi:hypothetical protein
MGLIMSEEKKEVKGVREVKGVTESSETSLHERIDPTQTFEKRLLSSQLRHNPDNIKTELIKHITEVIRAKKTYLQKKLLKNPNANLVLIRKYELSDSGSLAKMIGAETYPYYVNSDEKATFLDMFGFMQKLPTSYHYDYIKKFKLEGVCDRNEWSDKLLKNVKEILELENVDCSLIFFTGVSVWEGLDADRHHHICLKVNQLIQ